MPRRLAVVDTLAQHLGAVDDRRGLVDGDGGRDPVVDQEQRVLGSAPVRHAREVTGTDQRGESPNELPRLLSLGEKIGDRLLGTW
jgi:hypothetical protein